MTLSAVNCLVSEIVILLAAVSVNVTPIGRSLAYSPQPECVSCCRQGHVGSKTLLQQNVELLTVGAG